MNEEIWADGFSKTRSALVDVTNFVGKRGYSLISKSGVNTEGDHNKDEALRFGKKERLATENYKKENFDKQIVDSVLKPHLCSHIDSLNGNAIDHKAKVPCETKEPCPPGVRHNADSHTTPRSSNDARLSTRSSPISLPTRPLDRVETENDERIDSDENNLKERVEASISTNNGDDLTPENSDFNKGDYLDFSRVLDSQESRSSCLERSMEQKGGMDSIKACSCSFCMKVAYMWSDLHYQDIKGRIAAIKKSQKEAGILVERNSRNNEIGKYGQQSKFSKLESDLTDKWRSFFLHMEDIFALESNQLESSLLKLRVLREDCKSDLNPTEGINLNKK
ncbi:hypothetical protein Lser_V15G22389 [Lactuca serriola]